MAAERTWKLHFGPHHPSTHGVLRVELELEGEKVIKATPIIGQLHRGIEKIAEDFTFHQAIPLTDRLDYTAASLNNLGYVLAVEKLLGIEVPKRAQYLRVIISELSRIMGHHLWIGSAALDLGAMTVVFYTFADREIIMECIEEASGGRLTPTYMRIGGVAKDVTDKFIEKVKYFVKMFPEKIDGYETLLTDNIIWRQRNEDLAVISYDDAINLGLTGAVGRASGVNYDVRKAFPYSSYEDFDFEVPVGTKGDAFDRYMCRMEEFRQSVKIIKQAIENLPDGPVMADMPYLNPTQEKVRTDIDALIRRFKFVLSGFKAPKGEVYQSVEGSKGELGFYIYSDGGEKPYRLKIKSPCYIHVSALPDMVEGYMLSDIITAIGGLDIVLGEIDR
jgi:NADH dehydrogenase I D subunit